MNKLKEYIKHNNRLKRWVHWLLIPSDQAKPRLWVQWFVNPFFHKKGKGSVIRRRTRMDVLPFNRFEIGKKSIVEDFCTINNGVGDVIIGDSSFIGINNVVIGPVSIGNNVMTAQNVVISGLNHIYTDPDMPVAQQGVVTALVVIEDNSWIAANSVVVAGITIGRNSVVAAGTVVTKDVPPYSVVAGNPGKIIKKYDFQLHEWIKINTQ